MVGFPQFTLWSRQAPYSTHTTIRLPGRCLYFFGSMKTESVILSPGALVSRFGAAVVGVLIQVPVMLSVVKIVGAT